MLSVELLQFGAALKYILDSFPEVSHASKKELRKLILIFCVSPYLYLDDPEYLSYGISILLVMVRIMTVLLSFTGFHRT